MKYYSIIIHECGKWSPTLTTLNTNRLKVEEQYGLWLKDGYSTNNAKIITTVKNSMPEVQKECDRLSN